MISEELVFGSSDMFEVLAVQMKDDQVVLCAQSRKKQCACPKCNISSCKIHSYYFRKIKDLPAFDNRVILHIKAKKWYCHNPDCARQIFTERFDHFFKSYKRNSERLREKLLKIALLMGGNGGEKLCRAINITISSSSLIRLIHKQHVPAPLSVSAVGIDDWAYRKGVNYGTAIVDLDRHTVIDLLPDRESQTVEDWFKKRPEVTVVTRDRFTPYSMGITNGSPGAIQVADRWHLMKNMAEAIHTLLERKRQEIITAQTVEDETVNACIQEEVVQGNPVKRESIRHKRLVQIKKMHAGGVGIKAMARELRISRNTVRKYIHLHEPPSRKGMATTNLVRFNEYLYTRMQEDKKVKVVTLFKEIKAMGYNGGKSTLQSYLQPYTKQRNLSKLLKLARASWSPSKVSVLLCKKEELLSDKEKALVVDICNKSDDIREARILSGKFQAMMENKQGHLLRDWMEEVSQSSIQELKGFAKGLLNDYQAVENALTLPWSNGQVEGQINKLKTLKRQMYGRAGFEMLRKRVILHSAYYHQN